MAMLMALNRPVARGVVFVTATFATYLWFKKTTTEFGRSLASKITVPGTAVFAIGGTLSDAPTAVPLFAAVAQLPQLSVNQFVQYLWLSA